MRGQTRLHSALESFINILVGYLVAVGAQILIFPLFGYQITLRDNFITAIFFAVVSFARSYVLRRFFNWLHLRGF